MALGGSGPRRYAQALIDMATEERAVPAYRQSLERLAAALGPDVVHVLRDPRVPFERRRAALQAATQDEPAAVRAVLELLLDRDRIGIVPDIARVFGDLVDRREGIVKAKITTPVSLDEHERAELLRRLEHSSGKKVRATFAVDPALIGGAKVDGQATRELDRGEERDGRHLVRDHRHHQGADQAL
jgi:F-type H+-transporting ATPase subunit delta